MSIFSCEPSVDERRQYLNWLGKLVLQNLRVIWHHFVDNEQLM
jgi:hypothetical protein